MTFSKKDTEFINGLINDQKYKKFIQKGSGMSAKLKQSFVDDILNYSNKFKSPRTKLSKISQFKSYLKKNYNYPRLFNIIKAKEELKENVKELNFNSVKKRKQIKIKEKNLMDRMKEFKDSDDITHQFYYLAFVTGRRPVELLTSRFSLPKTKGIIKLKVVGLAKKRQKRESQYFINVINEFEPKEQILERINNIQEYYKDTKIDTAVKKLRYHFDRAFRMVNVPKIHTLRSAYAEWLFKYRNPEEIIRPCFIADVLNHDGISTAPHYQDVGFV
mgnify:CR=1 FL=1